MTTTPTTHPDGTPPVTAPTVALPGVYDAWDALPDHPRSWAHLPANTRGAVRVMWAGVRAGQSDPWLVALAGWRRRAAWYRRTYRSALVCPDRDDLDGWAGYRADVRDRDHEIAGQYLALAHHLTATHHPGPFNDDQADGGGAGDDQGDGGLGVARS
jgi:hypothetical protein